MSCYETLHIKRIINASEPYTNLGGSLMEKETVEAMAQAAECCIDYEALRDAVCEKAAQLTKNEAAFVTTGASSGLELSAGACMCLGQEEKMDMLPDTSAFSRNEIIVIDGDVLDIIPYWKLAGLTGAKIIKVRPDAESVKKAVCEKTAACMLFPSSVYERGIPVCEEIIPILKETGVKIIVDAAAQLPPASNLWYYTKELGADLTIFSGGKHIKGPQSTGLIVGDKELIRLCKMLASPNPRLGRAFKTGKEELVGFITALELFVAEDEERRFKKQEEKLLKIAEAVRERTGIRTEMLHQGRLGTYQPLLHLYLPENMTAKSCNEYTRSLDPAVDIGVYPPEFNREDNVVFVNAYNLKEGEEAIVADVICDYILGNQNGCRAEGEV